MTPLHRLRAEEAQGLRGLIFDLDGTLLSDGKLTLLAYGALATLSQTGMRLVVCTGRPAGWGEVLARQWPIDLCVTENGGAIALCHNKRLRYFHRHDRSERRAQQQRLATIVDALLGHFDDAVLVDDGSARITDVTFDIGELQHMPADRVAEMRQMAEQLGARTFVSSIHLHVTCHVDNKASGTIFGLQKAFGEDTSSLLTRYAFVGDSGNDDTCFGAFKTTFGVDNVRAHLASITLAPRYITRRSAGAGFAELAEMLIYLREAI